MTDRPINLRAAEVRAILDGRATQVWRPMRTNHVGYRAFLRWDGKPHTRAMMACTNGDPCRLESSVFCEDNRIGIPGDRLWVRETWGHDGASDRSPDSCWYRADPCKRDFPGVPCEHGPDRWSSSATMPRWASRLTLEVAAVRVARVQEIAEDDARASGCEALPDVDGQPWRDTARTAHRLAWDARHGKRAPWASAWAWAVTFTVVRS